MSNNNHVIEQITSQADIVKIIGKHVELKRSGNEFKGCCPFHGEKSPSFFVNPQKGVYNCFGCGVAGNALTFLKEYEHLTAGEALQELSRQTGIELPKEPLNKHHLYQKTPTPSHVGFHKASPLPAPTETVANPIPLAANKPTANKPITSSPITSGKTPPSLPPNLATTSLAFEETYHDIASYSAYGGDKSDFEEWFEPPFFPQEGYLQHHNNPSNFLPNALPNTLPNRAGQSPAFSPVGSDTGNLYDLLTKVSAFYQQQLAKNATALHYFHQRGLTEATLNTFELGYAPADWQHLERAFPQDLEGLRILGLIRTSERGKSYDFLRERVIFPIKDYQGRVIGFGGRAMSDEVKPKYLNSSESPMFKKGLHLYGLYEGRQVRAKDWLVVEGYMDVISLHQAGVYGAVAAMGTAITTAQIEKLLQLSPTLTLCFDGDMAGQKAAWRAMEVGLPALSDTKELRFLTLPQQHDPDTFVKAFGVSAMQKQIAHAIPLSQYLFSILSRRHDISIAEGRGKLLAEVAQLTQKLPKGSYGWLLREDMRAKMGLGKRQQAKAAQDALLNFDSNINSQRQLELCFLYQPDILGGYQARGMNVQLIEQIFQMSKADDVKFSSATIKNPNNTTQPLANEFRLPLSWEDCADVNLLTLVDWIQQIYPALEAYEQSLAGDYTEFELINAKAHYILAGLPTSYQASLLPRWQLFFAELQQRQVYDISDLVTELMIKLVMDGLQKKLIVTKDLRKKQWLKQQSQLIKTWQQEWFEQKEAS